MFIKPTKGAMSVVFLLILVVVAHNIVWLTRLVAPLSLSLVLVIGIVFTITLTLLLLPFVRLLLRELEAWFCKMKAWLALLLGQP